MKVTSPSGTLFAPLPAENGPSPAIENVAPMFGHVSVLHSWPRVAGVEPEHHDESNDVWSPSPHENDFDWRPPSHVELHALHALPVHCGVAKVIVAPFERWAVARASASFASHAATIEAGSVST